MNNDTVGEAVEAFAPQTREVTLAGKTYKVTPLDVERIWPILRHGMPIIESLAALAKQESTPAGSPVAGSAGGQALDQILGGDIATFLRLMADHGDAVMEIAAIALNAKRADIGKAMPDEAYTAVKAIVEVNRGFFETRLLPLLGQQPFLAGSANAIGAALQSNGAGETRSTT